MSRHLLSSTGCPLVRYQTSPATLYVQRGGRWLCSSSIAAKTSSSRSTNYRMTQGSSAFLVPGSCSPNRQPRPGAQAGSTFQCFQSQFAFSTTASNHATNVLLNPRVDEEGNPMMVEISQRAASRLRELTKQSTPSKEKPYHHLRITVTSGGCHGFQYLMSLDPSSKIDPEEDTVFEAHSQDLEDSSSDPTHGGEAKVVMDSASLELLHGSTVDYTVELIGSQFKIVDNPRATSNCGCGTSFDVE